MSVELTVRSWRITRGVPLGAHCWFDPSCEIVRIFSTHHDGEVHGLDKGPDFEYLDSTVSVSASEPSRATVDEERYPQLGLFEDELPF